MPELPEVETIRRDLTAIIRGKTITKIDVSKPKIVRGTPATLRRHLVGQAVATLERRGKLLLINFTATDRSLVLHLKMTGQLIYVDANQVIAGGHSYPAVGVLPNKYSHVIIHFADQSTLYFNDMRQFGYVALVTPAEKERIISRYGAEPLSAAFTPEYLTAILRGRKTSLKNVLLNQSLIAGLGNIYVDEAAHRAGVRPGRRADRLTKQEIRQLHRAIRALLTLALKHRGTTFNDYRDAHGRRGNFVRYLQVYGRQGKPCRHCHTPITRTVVSGRGTHFCLQCQQ